MADLPIYARWDQVPANLKTRNILHKQGMQLRPGQAVKAYKAGWPHSRGLYSLYDIGECVPKKERTAAQLAALGKAQKAQRDLHTCPRCGGESWQRVGGSRRWPRYRLGVGLCANCDEELRIIGDCDEAIDWARRMLAVDPAGTLILDSETTDLDGEILDLAIIDMAGRVVFQSYFYPQLAIAPGAQRIHGLTLTRLAYAPTWRDLYPEVAQLLDRADLVIIYNADFDLARIYQSCHVHGIEGGRHKAVCAMEWYAQYCGEWSDYHGNYRWQRLPGGDHTALGDCRATLRLIQDMAATKMSSEEEQPNAAN